MAVREIRGWTRATPLPNGHAALQGVVKLRGAILPIIDLRVQLGMPVIEASKQHVIIVVQVHDQPVGMVVDAVNDILTVTEEMVQPPPPRAGVPVGSSVEALIEVDGRLLTLLRLDALLPEEVAHAA